VDNSVDFVATARKTSVPRDSVETGGAPAGGRVSAKVIPREPSRSEPSTDRAAATGLGTEKLQRRENPFPAPNVMNDPFLTPDVMNESFMTSLRSRGKVVQPR